MKASQRIWSEVRSHVEALRAEGLPIYYAGHSLGGAIAALTDTLQPASAVYTFGMPRVGDAEFCHLHATRPIYRVVDCTDAVPAVPPRWLFSYRHLIDFRLLSHTGEYLDNPSAGETKAVAERAEQAYRALPAKGRIFSRSLADHTILNYSEGLLQAIAHHAGAQ